MPVQNGNKVVEVSRGNYLITSQLPSSFILPIILADWLYLVFTKNLKWTSTDILLKFK